MPREKMPHEEYRRRQNECQAKYDKENTIAFGFKLNKKTDGDIIERISAQQNKQQYFKNLVRKDIEDNP